MAERVVVAGTDGSAHGQAAVRWAARQTHRDGGSLLIVHADGVGRPVWPPAATEDRASDAERARQIVEQARREATEAVPGLRARCEVVAGDPVPALLSHLSARMIVVGNRGRGGFTSLLLGSVGRRVAVHADRPVVIVRGRTDADSGAGPVVVGTDGSPGGTRALGLAFAEAAARGAMLLALRTYDADLMPPVTDIGRLEESERSALTTSLVPWQRRFPGTPVQAAVVREGAARMLVDLSRTAALVVVGDRRAGRLAGTVLSTVTLRLIHHADCPVLIARP